MAETEVKAPKKDKKEVRFAVLSRHYKMFNQGVMDLPTTKLNLEFGNVDITEAELESFYKKYPEIEANQFLEFVKECGVLKASAVKKEGTGKGIGTRLNTEEGAKERGVTDENVAIYIEKVNQIYAISKEINALMTNARVSFAIPKEKPAEAKTEAPVVTEGNSEPA